jgi:hypothetical protein
MTHDARPVTPYGVFDLGTWPTKLYGLAVTGRPDHGLVEAARAAAAEAIPQQASREPGRQAAFVIAHQARPACFVLICWWATPVDLRRRYLTSPLDRPTGLDPMPADSVGCVWELALIEHERQAWSRHILTGTPDLSAYLTAPPPEQVR